MDAGALFREHHRALLRYLVRLTGDEDQAADALQESFARLLRTPQRVEQPRAWLYRVATNVVREQARSRRVRLRILAAAPARAPLADDAPGPAEDAAARERRRVVREALQRLSWKERTILLMREEGFKHREIAAAVGTTTGSVGTMIARALEKLAGELDLDREEA
jgi:RNA polymerase sigma-70 factor (ECF subfamily)